MRYSFKDAIENLKNIPAYNVAKKQLKFLVDAQLPLSLSEFIKEEGFDSIHTLDLPDKNATTDRFIRDLASVEKRILITKDDDFLHSWMILKKPEQLVLVKTGNISNKELLSLFAQGIDLITLLLSDHSMIEITRFEVIAHR